jgi:hypothetical protein
MKEENINKSAPPEFYRDANGRLFRSRVVKRYLDGDCRQVTRHAESSSGVAISLPRKALKRAVSKLLGGVNVNKLSKAQFQSIVDYLCGQPDFALRKEVAV